MNTKKSDKSVFLINVLNLATELQSSKVILELFHGLTTRWAKSIYVDQLDCVCGIISTDDPGSLFPS